MSSEVNPTKPSGKKKDSLRVTIRKEVWPVCILIGMLTVYVVHLVVGEQVSPIKDELVAIREELRSIASRPIQLQQQQTTLHHPPIDNESAILQFATHLRKGKANDVSRLRAD